MLSLFHALLTFLFFFISFLQVQAAEHGLPWATDNGFAPNIARDNIRWYHRESHPFLTPQQSFLSQKRSNNPPQIGRMAESLKSLPTLNMSRCTGDPGTSTNGTPKRGTCTTTPQ